MDDAGDPHRVPLWRRRWLWVCVVSVLVAGVIGAGVGALVYVNTYQPLAPGNFYSTIGLHARALADGMQDTRLIVIGPAGTQARVEFSLSNDGSRDARILGLGPDSGLDRILWGPSVDAKRVGGGTPAEARPFPMTLRAGGEISLWVCVTQPK